MDSNAEIVNNYNYYKPKKRIAFLPYLIIAIVAVLVASIAIPLLSRKNPSISQAATSPPASQKVQIAPPVQTMQINKSFSISLPSSSGTNILTYSLDTAEKRDEIILNGQTARAIAGKTFLILKIKLRNETNQEVKLNAKDYVRLSVNNNTVDWLAPDIHNDPVDVQFKSTKETRLGFPINTGDKNLKLQIGDPKGKQEIIDLNL